MNLLPLPSQALGGRMYPREKRAPAVLRQSFSWKNLNSPCMGQWWPCRGRAGCIATVGRLKKLFEVVKSVCKAHRNACNFRQVTRFFFPPLCAGSLSPHVGSLGLPQWLNINEFTCNAGDGGDVGSIPGPGRYSWVRK